MNLYEAIEIICKDYCKYPDIESGNKLADICDKCPMNECEDLRWADRKTEPTISKMEQVDKDINVRSKDEPQKCSVNDRPYTECSACEHFRCMVDEPQYRSE